MSSTAEQSAPQDLALRTFFVMNAHEDESHAFTLLVLLESRLNPHRWRPSGPDADALVVLLSAAFLASSSARGKLHEWMARHPHALLLPLLLDDTDPIEASKLVRTEVIRSSAGSVYATEEPAKVIADLAEQVVAALARESDATPPSHDEPLPADHHHDSADGDDRVQGLTAGLQPYPAVMKILLEAQNIANIAGASLSTTDVLIAIANAGAARGSSTWSPDWLRTQLGERFEKLRNDHLRRAGHEGGAPSAEPPRPNPGVRDALERAASIATRTTGKQVIHTRHLIAALLTDPRPAQYSAVTTTLLSAGLSLSELRESFLGTVTGFGDNDGAWRELLTGPGEAVRHLGGFHADDPRGTDVIWIGQEVMALATTIAARTVKPPLSIGLFGEWGTGKSFFMREVRRTVEELSREGRDDPHAMQRDLPFYKRIVQIDFNAWHYVEGNLWASLVEHIFDNLHIGGTPRAASEELKRDVLQKLQFEEAVREEAAARESDAKAEVEQAKLAATAMRGDYEQKQAELARLRGTDVLQALPLPEIWREVQPLLQNVGLQESGSHARELGDALRAARDALGRGWAVLLPLLHAPDRWRRWVYLLVGLAAVPAVAVAAGWMLRELGTDSASSVAETVAGLMTLLATATAWLRRQAAWLSGQTRKLYRIQRRYDARVASALAAGAARVAAAEAALRLAEAELMEAQRVTRAAEQRVTAVQAELADATAGRLLARFVEDRAASLDYRKHLGVLALVRDDFEKLSSLIDEENWRLDPDDPATDKRYPGSRYATLDEERKQENTRINRIVLYIDDLDRCPPAKVVEVLQAVHLLLAFPLFVVVVGVDARWVTRSLETHYAGLLSPGADAEPDEKPGASARDYLEKIFQIPFWLRPMSNDACTRMLNELLGSRSGAHAAAPEKAPGPANKPRAAGASGGTGSTSSQDPPRSAPAPGHADHSGPAASPGSPAPKEQAPRRPNLRSLEITEGERRFISGLAPLLDRSPRSLKRFVNVYRLLKAGLSADETDAFTRLKRYRMALFLLAVDTAFPEIAATVFAAIETEVASTPEPHSNRAPGIESLRATLRDLEHHLIPAQRPQYRRLQAWVTRDTTELADGFDLLQLATWVPRVQRYSFHAPPSNAAAVH
jgi:hypothetical protein